MRKLYIRPEYILDGLFRLLPRPLNLLQRGQSLQLRREQLHQKLQNIRILEYLSTLEQNEKDFEQYPATHLESQGLTRRTDFDELAGEDAGVAEEGDGRVDHRAVGVDKGLYVGVDEAGEGLALFVYGGLHPDEAAKAQLQDGRADRQGCVHAIRDGLRQEELQN